MGVETGMAAGATVELAAEAVWQEREPVAEAVRQGWELAAETGTVAAVELAAEAVGREREAAVRGPGSTAFSGKVSYILSFQVDSDTNKNKCGFIPVAVYHLL